jgi:hypothetical protein
MLRAACIVGMPNEVLLTAYCLPLTAYCLLLTAYTACCLLLPEVGGSTPTIARDDDLPAWTGRRLRTHRYVPGCVLRCPSRIDFDGK